MDLLRRAFMFPLYLVLGFLVFSVIFFYEFPRIIFDIFSINHEKGNKLG